MRDILTLAVRQLPPDINKCSCGIYVLCACICYAGEQAPIRCARMRVAPRRDGAPLATLGYVLTGIVAVPATGLTAPSGGGAVSNSV